MKTCGIEIDNDTAIFVGLEKRNDNTIEINEHSTKLTLTNHESASVIKEYVDLIHSQLDTLNPDKIAIIKRQIKGRYSSGGLSFKIEGLIQTYKGMDVELIPMPTIKAFVKKNPLSINPDFKYQDNALSAAYYLLNK